MSATGAGPSPIGTTTSTRAAFAAALLDPALPGPRDLASWNGSDPERRLAVHRNNVIVSLVDALAETFPVVQALVGAEFFRAMASVFVRRAPPRSPVLAHYGGELPAFIERFEPAQSVPYLADVARLEWARVQAYHAADDEVVSRESIGLALGCAERAGELRLTLHPSLCAIRSAFAIVSLWAAHQGARDIGTVDPASAEDALIVREQLDVLVLLLPPGACEFVDGVRNGQSLARAAARAAEAAPEFDLGSTFGLLMRHGALTSLHLPERNCS